MKEQSEIDINIIRDRIIELGETLHGNLPYNMPPLQVILSFLFLRRIDCMIGKYAKESSEFYQKYRERYSDERMLSEMQSRFGGFPFYNFSGINFDSILLSDKSIDIVINNYIQGFSIDVQVILEGLLLRNIIAILQRQSKFLEIVIRTFQEIDLSMSSVDDEEFVELTYSLIERMGGSYRGGHMTPLPLARLMTEIVFTQTLSKEDPDDLITIYDPVCGTGGLLALAYNKAISCHSHHHLISLYGQDLDFYSHIIAKAMVLLLGNEYSVVFHGDTLTEDKFPGDKYDYILADMPFGQSWKHIKDKIERESLSKDGRFIAGLPVVNDSQFLYIEHMVSKMAESGSRVVFATTGSVLWNGSASSGESRIRRWLFENDLVECIVALPNNSLFPYSSIPLYLWVITNKKDVVRKGKTQLINISDINAGISRISPLNEKIITKIVNSYKKFANSEICQIISNEKFGFYEISYFEGGKKTSKKVTFDLNTNVEEYFAANIIPFAKGKVDIDYSSVEKGYTISFNKFFTKQKETISIAEITSQNITPLLISISAFQNDVDNILKMELTSDEEIRQNTSDWAEYPLSYLTKFINGAIKPKKPDAHGLPYLSIPYLRDNTADVETFDYNTLEEKVVNESDVLLISKGYNVGEVFRGVKGIASNSLVIIRPQDNYVLSSYIYYMLKGYESIFRNKSMGVTIKSLDTRSIGLMKFILPPITIQEKIVSFLDGIDKNIDLFNRLIANKDNVFSSYRQVIIESAVKGKLKIR